jgi:hypothetical protein
MAECIEVCPVCVLVLLLAIEARCFLRARPEESRTSGPDIDLAHAYAAYVRQLNCLRREVYHDVRRFTFCYFLLASLSHSQDGQDFPDFWYVYVYSFVPSPRLR